MRLVTAGQICRVLAIERRTLDRWITDGIVTPALPSPGKGGRHLFSAVDLLAVALARDLRRRGFSLPACSAALEALRGRELADLQREWQAGRTHLLVVSGEATPYLLPQRTITYPAVSDRLAGKLWAWIDVSGAYAQLASVLDAQSAKERMPA
jgi:DNA-binding transcriptional MerR regulator